MACKLLAYLTSGLRGFFWNVISYYFESERGLPAFEAPRYFCKGVFETQLRERNIEHDITADFFLSWRRLYLFFPFFSWNRNK